MQDSGIGNGSNMAEALHWAQGDESVNYTELQHGGNLGELPFFDPCCLLILWYL